MHYDVKRYQNSFGIVYAIALLFICQFFSNGKACLFTGAAAVLLASATTGSVCFYSVANVVQPEVLCFQAVCESVRLSMNVFLK